MTILQSLILGILQGLTEFLPISSSGHLVIFPFLMGWNIPIDQAFPFDVLVQLGTLTALIIYFWKDLWGIIKAFVSGLLQRKPFADPQARLGWYLILATIPAGIAGLLIKSTVEAAFSSPAATAGFLFVTAALLLIAEKVGKRSRPFESLTWKDALWVGCAQIISLFPGVSRSGATIAGGMTRDFDRPSAARFSFLMSVPVMLAAGLLSILDLRHAQNLSSFLPVLVVGFVTAAVVGYLAIHWLLKFLTGHSLVYFAIYCLVLGILTLTVWFLRPQPVAQAVPSTTMTQAVSVEISPSLGWLRPALNACTQNQPNLALVVTEKPANLLDSSTADVRLRWGAPVSLSGIAFELAQDALVLVVHPDNSLARISAAQLAALYSHSGTQTWLEALSGCTECSFKKSPPGFGDQTIQRWAYPSGDDTGLVFQSQLKTQTSPQVNLAPDPQALRQAVAADPAAIGFLPAHWLDSSVRLLPVANLASGQLNQPVLAITSSEPGGALRAWLNCIQKTFQP
jgi:undecaprenyl-diphosphatase